MSKKTIFGEENFFDREMIKLFQIQSNAIDNYIFNQMGNVIKGSISYQFPQVIIDEKRLRRWVKLCLKLENVEYDALLDIASKKKIEDLQSQLAHQKEMWDELKEWASYLCYFELVDKMQELEGEKDDI